MLWDDFLNSEWREWNGDGTRHDALDDPEWIKKWLSDHRLSVYRPPSGGELAELKNMRSSMLHMVDILVKGQPIPGESLAELNAALALGTMTRRITSPREGEGFRLEIVPLKYDWQQIKSDIAASFSQTLADGEASRFRICDNPNCCWVYYDQTRNRSKRYCSDTACGNLMKVRRFRAKQKTSHKQP